MNFGGEIVRGVLGGGWGVFIEDSLLWKWIQQRNAVTIECNLGRKDIKNLETILTKRLGGVFVCFQS